MKWLWGCILLLASMMVHADLPAPVADSLRKSGIPAENVAVYAQRIDQVQPLIDHQSDQPMKTASTMKLLSTYAGLELLGPDYRWRTGIYHDGRLENGVLHGNLIIKGRGDPYLLAADMQALLEDLRQAGVQDIRGDIVLDTHFFAARYRDTAAFDDKPHAPYNAAPDAFAVNIKSTTFNFLAGNGRLEIEADPALPEIHIANQMTLVRGECGDWKSRLRFVVEPQENEVNITFVGEYPASCRDKALELNVLEDGPYAYNLFRQHWLALGGKLQGGWRYGTLPEQAVHLMTHQSQSLAEIIRTINKYSNNLMVRQLFLTVAAERVTTPALEEDGVLAIKAWLASKGLYFPELVLENGSGLSRNEQITARHMADFLRAAYSSPVMPEYVSSLPLPSTDGTMANRLKNSPARGNVHLKTGTINGVSALAGYVHDQKGRRWVTVIMVNDPKASASRAAQDAFIDWIYRQP
ncbi:D-alanyl-D-alanine carboxypeptidase / D-alanyl-D-alanine-endopeptidase (penicillin-binding protein 4) [Methylobacillus rhizosphaerae]|uniref:D-alanyl-D-alanine carboxypeptidase / D-alanyl-D-alanine-endopeptidase (Penicillin-binding protein 4) n=1 Tax=Methylobacillus rhizosphaerae TaxID=551994 RepID=A0A239A2M3_9PROT|nr:D-alanyl-D-alanine carboxypeptidase/D-alanyl-D-alanine-endopeptidase [Methylobacillus rhizosphaerae]SNR89810.1 D-alanyl-D-alanine carboxypeptidase / D-alanyl-D-alanine-endopeptidase (penicillin-binding protein 4) [Methylobacillus rhizosphaerae]